METTTLNKFSDEKLKANFCVVSNPAAEHKWMFDSDLNFIKDKEILRLYDRLENIIECCKDDEDAMPIGEKAVSNFILMITSCKGKLFRGWNLFANNNGTLSLEFKRGENVSSAISIGYDDMSYFVQKKNETVHILGKEPFSVETLKYILQKVAFYDI